MHAQGQPVDLQAIVGNMDEEHREWFASAMNCTVAR